MSERTRPTISLNEPLLCEAGSGDRTGFQLPPLDVPAVDPAACLGGWHRRQMPDLPELSEVEVMQHFTRLSTWNYHIDLGLYPLGSCTMKYNPRLNERMAALPGFRDAHPLQLHENTQGCLRLLRDLEQALLDITGMAGVTLQPMAGAHGELAGLMLIRAALTARGNPRRKVLIPDSAHGTNPATAVLCGYETVSLPSNDQGCLDLDTLSAALDDETACLMLTNPNTLGVFETHIQDITRLAHERGALVYMDGANFNAFVGVARPVDMGIDVMHINLHKTFSTPHGGGGPGAGPVVVGPELVPFLPVPRVAEKPDGSLFLDYHAPHSIGRVAGFYGNFGVLARALTYIQRLGHDGLREVAEHAVLTANYLRRRLAGAYNLPYDQPTLHEVVFDETAQQANGVSAMDVAKRLLDKGFHPPTVYFPLIVHGALMIEPTETATKSELDAFAAAMLEIAREAKETPDVLKATPAAIRHGRFDETTAARKPILTWMQLAEAGD